jgi:hypothetical protein
MKKITIAAMIAVLLMNCRPSSEITGSWKNPNQRAAEATEKIESILVTALTERTNARQTIENEVAAALESQGFKTVKSIDVLPPTFTNGQTPDRRELLNRIKDSQADAILTIALIDKETETRYTPGNVAYAPVPRFGYYGTFWGYYNTWSPTLYAPGYYNEDKVYFIETNLYDAESEELLWSAQSETYNPRSLPEFSRGFTRMLVTAMKDEGLLTGGSRTELAREPGNEQ